MLLWILIAGTVVSVLVAVFYDLMIAFSVLAGVSFVLLNQLFMLHQIDQMDTLDIQAGQTQVMLGAAKRFLCLIIFLSIGYYVGLHLLAVAAGLAVAYLNLYAYSAAALFRN